MPEVGFRAIFVRFQCKIRNCEVRLPAINKDSVLSTNAERWDTLHLPWRPTVLKDSQEQTLIGQLVPPESRKLCVIRIRNTDLNFTVRRKHVHTHRLSFPKPGLNTKLNTPHRAPDHKHSYMAHKLATTNMLPLLATEFTSCNSTNEQQVEQWRTFAFSVLRQQGSSADRTNTDSYSISSPLFLKKSFNNLWI